MSAPRRRSDIIDVASTTVWKRLRNASITIQDEQSCEFPSGTSTWVESHGSGSESKWRLFGRRRVLFYSPAASTPGSSSPVLPSPSPGRRHSPHAVLHRTSTGGRSRQYLLSRRLCGFIGKQSAPVACCSRAAVVTTNHRGPLRRAPASLPSDQHGKLAKQTLDYNKNAPLVTVHP